MMYNNCLSHVWLGITATTITTILNTVFFRVNLDYPVPLGFFLDEDLFVDKWQRFLQVGCSTCQSINSVKA